MKMTLIKGKTSKSDSRKHERNTCESEAAKKRQLEKLAEMEEQLQPKVRKCQFKVCTSFRNRLNIAHAIY